MPSDNSGLASVSTMDLLVVLSSLFFIISTAKILPPETKPLRIRYPKTQWINPGDTILKSCRRIPFVYRQSY
jgi:hypothetical protein